MGAVGLLVVVAAHQGASGAGAEVDTKAASPEV